MLFSTSIGEILDILIKISPAAIGLVSLFVGLKQFANKLAENRNEEIKKIKEDQPEFFRKVRKQSVDLLER